MILLFGSNSFVGKNLKVDHKVSRQEYDLTKYDQVLKALRRYKPSHVINCAAAHGSAKAMSTNNAEYMTTNIVIDSNILKAAHSLDIENIILMSSISAFPEIKGRDINENDLHVGQVNQYNFGYNSSKRISSDLCKSYVLDYKRNYRALFLGNLYGEHATFKVDSNMLNSIIFQIYSSKITGENLTLYGTGEDQRAFTYVNDLNQFIPKFFAKKEIKSYIFSSTEVFSVREIVEKVSKVIDFKGRVQFSGEITNNQKRKVASVDYLSKSFPDFRFTPFDVGLEKTIAWFLKSVIR